jgi:hypothetical protein
MSTVLSPKLPVFRSVSRLLALGALGALFYGCAAKSDSPSDESPPTNTARTGGSSGASSGGSSGSSNSGGSSGNSSGGSAGSSSGGSVGSGGASASGGSGASSGGDTGSSSSGGAGDTGGSTGTASGGSNGAGGSTTDGPTTTSDAGPPSSGGKHPIMPGNVLLACKGPAKYRLPDAPAADFCAFYEMYCHYDPTGMEKNKGAAPPAGQEPWFYKDYDDCIARYTAAKPAAQSCRAGQLCGTNFKAGQGCTHSTGHFDTCP